MPPTTLDGLPTERARDMSDTEHLVSKILDRMVHTDEGPTTPLPESTLVEGALRDMWRERDELGLGKRAVIDQERFAQFFTELRAQPGRQARYKQDPAYILLERTPGLLREYGQYCQGRSGEGRLTLHAPGDSCPLCTGRSGTAHLPAAKSLLCVCSMLVGPGATECDNCGRTRAEFEAELAVAAAAEAEELANDPVERAKAALRGHTHKSAEMVAAAILLASGKLTDASVTGKSGDGECDIEAFAPEVDENGNVVRDADGRPRRGRRVVVQVKGGNTSADPRLVRMLRGSCFAERGWEPWLVTFGDRTVNADVAAHGSSVRVHVMDGTDLAKLALECGVTIPDTADEAAKLLVQVGGTLA